MKGQGLALHGSKPHLHILIRIDRLLPCLHDLSCVFMWVGSLWPLCRDIGLALRAGDICFAENIRDAGFLFFLFFWALLKRGSISSGIQFNQYKGDKGKHQIVLHRAIRARMCTCRKYILSFPPQFSSIKSLNTWSYTELLTGFTLIINQGRHSRKAHSQHMRTGTCLAERTMDQYFASSAKWHSVASVIDVQNDNYSLFRKKPLLNGTWWKYTFINEAT